MCLGIAHGIDACDFCQKMHSMVLKKREAKMFVDKVQDEHRGHQNLVEDQNHYHLILSSHREKNTRKKRGHKTRCHYLRSKSPCL